MSLAVLTDGVLRRRSLTCRGIPSTSTAWSETTSVTMPLWCRVSHVAPGGLTLTESPTANRPFFSSGSSVARSTPAPNGVCVHDVSRGCPRVAAVSRRNVVQVHRLFHRAILSRSDDLHASMASLRYAIAGRSVGTSVPHSDSPPGDELRKGPSSESGVVVR
ncbi:hypothetical protein T12_10513 [Trichinella patagoniensis]|uniref:Uncharacterized protein n=1 Tax=Trichinella patagoniensis TaxID=990121 RepID=A0A0V0Z4B2_9BILA|nr:hypothetical protein T12_2716 [Trichinella patagoniensis]KRY07332.1 hypothetical protein T12_166 [Trichinella patagoniensis]KRY20069.1 hypothetical protein T12_10513 [Trichinella patagoniensis]